MTSRVQTGLLIPRPVPEVFAFAADLRNRSRFLPANHRDFQVLTRNFQGVDARASYELAVGGHSRRLELRIAEYEEERRFVERSGVDEPTFTTTWGFATAPGGTQVTMTVEYRAVPGLLGALADLLLARGRIRRNYAEQLCRLKQAMEAG